MLTFLVKSNFYPHELFVVNVIVVITAQGVSGQHFWTGYTINCQMSAMIYCVWKRRCFLVWQIDFYVYFVMTIQEG